jgi:hypothetical protein
MANPNSVVSDIVRFIPPLDRATQELLRSDQGLSVELGDARRLRLDPTNPRSAGFVQILDGLRKLNQPAYLEIDPATSSITRLLIPHWTRVLEVRPLDADAVSVELEMSHARHVLLRSHEDFAGLERQLQEAKRSGERVVVTEDDAHAVIDVRSFKPSPDRLPPPEPPAAGTSGSTLLRRLKAWFCCFWCWPWWPWRWCCCVPAARAQQLFNDMSATSCNPLSVPPPCIPFLYPDDGCWGRAHEMCRLLLNLGASPRKVWIQGNLAVSTRNNPSCHVYWGWHVAPTVCVRGPRFFQRQRMVIDPSLFAAPVSEATWKGVQGDPNATLTASDAAIFYLWGNVTDPTYSQTNQVLATYRLQLQSRSLTYGPPPYANCP